MTTLVNIDFSSALSVDFNGATSAANVTGGDLQFTGEGFILTQTSMGTGDKWMRFAAPVLGTSECHVFFGLGDSSGNVKGWSIYILSSNLYLNPSTYYTTYTTWDSDTPVSITTSTAFTAGQYIGVTFEVSTHTVRVWSNVTDAAPASINSWNGRAADGSSTTITFVANSNYVGFGSDTSSGWSLNSVDNFTAGDFSAAVSIEQEGFRFRNDDGSESAATWKANQDTNITLAANTAFRLRFLLKATGDPDSIDAQVEARVKPSGGAFGAWEKIN